MVHPYGSRPRAQIDATAAVPALIREHDYRWLALFLIRIEYVHLASQALIASVADHGIEDHRPVRSRGVWIHIDLFGAVSVHQLSSLFYSLTNPS
jgi:hypothetical protein